MDTRLDKKTLIEAISRIYTITPITLLNLLHYYTITLLHLLHY